VLTEVQLVKINASTDVAAIFSSARMTVLLLNPPGSGFWSALTEWSGAGTSCGSAGQAQ
jgi:hypothetical protein